MSRLFAVLFSFAVLATASASHAGDAALASKEEAVGVLVSSDELVDITVGDVAYGCFVDQAGGDDAALRAANYCCAGSTIYGQGRSCGYTSMRDCVENSQCRSYCERATQ
jgi:hypothetical protein